MNILVKFPTRGRPDKFANVLMRYCLTQKTKNVKYLVSYDYDDKTMTPAVIDKFKHNKNIQFVGGYSVSKIDACNRDMDKAPEFDILILASDDMIPMVDGWDQHIISAMRNKYPDTDGVLYFPDGYTNLNTMCIMGKAYYDRFGYVYHPSYISLWCDNEFEEVADKLGKQSKFNKVLFRHENPANSPQFQKDVLYRENEKFYNQDQKTYQSRKKINFGL